MKQAIFILNNLDSIGVLITLAYTLFKRIAFKPSNIFIFYYLLVQAILNILSGVLAAARQPNIFLYQLNCVVSLVILTLFFDHILRLKLSNKPIYFASWILCGMLIIYVVFFESHALFNSHSYSYTSLILILYCLLYFYRKITHPASGRITKDPLFWYNTGFFIYYSAAFLIFISYGFLTQNQKVDTEILWRLHNIIFFFMCIYLMTGFVCSTYQKTY